MSTGEDQSQAVAALYQAERTENVAVINSSLAMVGAALTYLVATLAFSDKFGSSVGWIFVVLLPLPLWLAAAFHSLLVVAAMLRAISIQVLEDELMTRGGLPPWHRDVVGYRIGEGIMNITNAHWPHKLAGGLVHVGIAAVVVGYTGYILITGGRELGGLIWLFVGLYLVLSALVAISWWVGLRQVARHRTVLNRAT